MPSALDDIRDVSGRLSRLVVAIVVGGLASFAIAMILPKGPDRGFSCLGRHGARIVMEDAPILIAGAIAIALAVYALLNRR